MSMIIILFISLVFITFINYNLFNKEYIAPAVIFSGSFAFSSFWLILFKEKWNVNLHFNTICVILLGVIFFSIVCLGVSYIYQKQHKNDYKKIQELKEYQIDNFKVILFVFLGIIIIVLTLYYTIKAVNGSFSNISSSLYRYRNLTAYKGQDLNIPSIIDILSGVLHASSYWFMYIFISNYIKNKTVNVKLLLVIILSVISSALDGSRGALINNILAFIPMYYLLKNKSNGFSNSKLKVKSILILVLLAVVLLSSLKWTAKLLGRNDISDMNTLDYVAMYVGAEINNLDAFLQERNGTQEKLFGIHTFGAIYTTIENYIGHDLQMELKPKYRFVNGYNLGNVHTIFYDFICDEGYVGIIVFPFIMAILSQILYEKSKRLKFNEITPNITIIAYAYIFGGIVFSFFGNKFFPQVFSFGFVKYIILWLLYNWFFCKLKIVFKYKEN